MTSLSVQSVSSQDLTQWGSATFANDHRIDIEIVDTEALRALGLMHRNHLAENQGMLFVHSDQTIRHVWMKNTLIALDIIFLSDDGKIVSVLRNLPPCAQDPCPISASSAPAQYMLEVNAGFIDKHGIQPGQEVLLEYKHEGRHESPGPSQK